MDTLNKTLSIHAVQLLTMCYFPGVIAAYIQLFRGTKYSRFPKWLDRWLKMRKQLGLLMLFSACLHVSPVVILLFQTRLETFTPPRLASHWQSCLQHTSQIRPCTPPIICCSRTLSAKTALSITTRLCKFTMARWHGLANCFSSQVKQSFLTMTSTKF